MPNHASPSKLWDGKTHFYQSYNPRRLIFFVHGLNGAPTSWLNFPALLVDDPVCALDDLLFYGYDSRRQAGRTSADLLFQHCNELLTRPERFRTALGFTRDLNFQYDRIVFIAHSFGGPVVRTMLLRACHQNVPWLRNITLALFAPATAGVRSIRFVQRMAMMLRLRLFYSLFEYRSPAYEDLLTDSRGRASPTRSPTGMNFSAVSQRTGVRRLGGPMPKPKGCFRSGLRQTGSHRGLLSGRRPGSTRVFSDAYP